MTRTCTVVAALLLSAGVGAVGQTQQPRSPLRQHQSFTATATAVLVDVVVRDRKGRPITDLSAADFEVSEDGLPQRVDSFTRVSRGGGIGVGVAWRSPASTVVVTRTSDAGPDAAADSATDEGTTAVVFDHLSAETLRLVQNAALAYVPMSGESGVRVGVFATDPGLRVLQRYTTDRTLIRRAVERVAPSGVAAEEQKAERGDELIARRRELRAENATAIAGAGTSSGAALAQHASEVGERENELARIQTELNMIRSFDNLDRDQRGYDTGMSLLAVVQSLTGFPGRKTIVFFSEGLPVSPSLSAGLDYIIDAANHANVTAYAIDANGLRAQSTLTAMRKEMATVAEERFSQLETGQDRTDQPLTMALERIEDTLKLDSRTGLARLAEDTGGFLVEQSNDLSSAFRRIDEDSQFHYLLTYSPTNTNFDGKFRTIHVTVRLPGAQVFARKGYRAAAAPGRIDTGGYEIPAVALLDRTPLPNAFPVHAGGFSFPDPGRSGLTAVLVKVGTDALRFTTDARRSTYSGQAAIVVRIRDGHGDEVERVSQQYLLTGETKDLDAARQGEILFYRELDLPPGVYTMESIVFDAAARHGSARVATLTIPGAEPSTIGMSSLVLVNRVEEVSDPPPAASRVAAPLYVGRMLLYPNLGEPLGRSATRELPFYFALYGDVHAAKASAQLLRNGQVLAEAPVPLPPASGARVQHVGRLPVGALPAGTYELRIRVTDAQHEASRTAYFTLRD